MWFLKDATPKSHSSNCFSCSSPSWTSFFCLTHASCSTRSLLRSIQSLLQYETVRRHSPSLAATVAKDLNILKERREHWWHFLLIYPLWKVFLGATLQMIKEYAKQFIMDFVRYWLLGAVTCVCVENICGLFMIKQCLQSVSAALCVMHRYVNVHKMLFLFLHARVRDPRARRALHSHVAGCSFRDPRGWWLAELPATAILTDWSSMCYTPINGSNYQWARLWTLQTEVNKHNRSWGGPERWGWRGINLFTKGLRLVLLLTGKVTKSFCLIIMLTQLVQQSSPSRTSNRINEIL